MKPDEKIMLVLTFLTGAFLGAVLYVMVFAPEHKSSEVGNRAELSIIGEMYGGCSISEFGCDSFRYEGDGSYQYKQGDEKIEGKVSAALAREIEAQIENEDLDLLATRIEPEECVSFVDGLDFRYEINVRGTRYSIDTCRTIFDYGSELQLIFGQLWEEMAEGKKRYPVLLEEGLGGWVVNELNGQ